MRRFTSPSSSQQRLLAARAHGLCQSQTLSEQKLWAELSAGKLGVTFRRQVPVCHRFIVDFLAPSIKLVVEIDGSVHAKRRAVDARRDERLRRAGFRVVRFTVEEVVRDVGAVVARLRVIVVVWDTHSGASAPRRSMMPSAHLTSFHPDLLLEARHESLEELRVPGILSSQVIPLHLDHSPRFPYATEDETKRDRPFASPQWRSDVNASIYVVTTEDCVDCLKRGVPAEVRQAHLENKLCHLAGNLRHISSSDNHTPFATPTLP
jgi:very-short-patch-repair endonuclease